MSTTRFNTLRKSSNRESDILIDIDRYENGQDVIRLSSKYRTITDGADSYYYEGLLVSASGMDERLPIDTQYKEQGDCILTFANQRINCQEIGARFSDLLNEGLAGAKVIIRQFFGGCEWSDVEDEIIYTGWIITEQATHDENEISLTISPYYKKYPSIPIYRMEIEDYEDMDPEGEGLIMPIVFGELKHDGKESYNSLIEMDAAYGGALLLSPKYIKYDSGDYLLLVAGHTCNTVYTFYKDLTADTSPTYYNTDIDGPDWRLICTVAVDGAPHSWDADADWSVDVSALTAPGPLTRDPIRNTREVLNRFYGLRYEDDDLSEIDYGTGVLTFTSYLWSAALYCDGIINSEMTMEQFLTKMMGQFPFWIYRGRNGKIYFKKWERRPAVDYTDCELSFEEQVLKDGFEVFYSTSKGPNISMPFWPNLGRDIADDVCRDGYFQRAFVQCTLQDSGYALDEDVAIDELEWNVTGAGTFPITGDLVVCGREICEVRLPASPSGSTVTVWRRGGNGTTAAMHSTGDRIYIARTNSGNGRCAKDQMGNSDNSCEDIEIYEDASHQGVVTLSDYGYSNHCKLFRDADRLAEAWTDCLNSATFLAGTYVCEWNPLSNFYRIYTTDSKQFQVKLDLSDDAAKVMGFWEDTALGTSHYGSHPARKRECQAAYDMVTFRNHAGWEWPADWIVGTGLTYAAGSTFMGDLTPLTARDYLFDIFHRPMRHVKFRTTDRFINLTLGKVFQFASDINDYLRVHGEQWTDMNWQVINIRHIDIDELEFIAQEAT